MHLYTDGNEIVFPYTMTDLRADNPNVSFGDRPPEDVLAQFGVYPVTVNKATLDPDTHKAVLGEPYLLDGAYYVNEEILPLSDDELAAIAEAQDKAAQRQKLIEAKSRLEQIRDQVEGSTAAQTQRAVADLAKFVLYVSRAIL
jgi:molecular chaperone GrpE (heat shock protein)